METKEQKKPVITARVSPIEVPMKSKEKRKPKRHIRVAASKLTMETQEEIYHMAPTIRIETHNMAPQI